MALKAVVKSLDEVDEAVRSLYAKRRDGSYELDVDVSGHSGVSEIQSQFEDAKSTRDKAKKAQREFLERLGVESVEDAAKTVDDLLKLKKDADSNRTKKLLDEGKLEEILTERTAEMKRAHEAALKKLQEDNGTLRGIAERAMVDQSLLAAATTAGVRNTAMTDVLLRGKQVFHLDGDKVIAKDGEKTRFGSDGNPLTMSEWLEKLHEDAPHLFEPSNGGGATGGSRQGGSDGFTLTREQARDPATYRNAKERAAKEGKDLVILQ